MLTFSLQIYAEFITVDKALNSFLFCFAVLLCFLQGKTELFMEDPYGFIGQKS